MASSIVSRSLDSADETLARAADRRLAGSRLQRLPFASPRWNFMISAAGLLSIAAVCAIVLAWNNASYVTVMLHDVFVFLDGAYRLSTGQVPHVDFHTPLGALTYVLPYLGLTVAGQYGGALPFGMAIAVAVWTLLALHIVASRFIWFIGIPLAVYFILLLSAPVNTGDNSTNITMAMFYNRIGWAFLSLLFILYVEPRSESRLQPFLDGLAAGTILLILFYTKLSYAAVAVVFLALWWLLRSPDWRCWITTSVVVFAGIAVVEVVWRLHHGYFSDIATSISASSAIRGGMMGFVAVAFRQIDHIVLAVLALGLLLLARLVSVRDLVFGAFVIGSAIAIDNQNALGRGLPALVVIVALGAQRLVGDQSARDGARAGLGFAAALALLVAFLAEPVAYQARALARHFANTLTPAAAPQVPPPLARIRVEDRDADVVAMLEATWGAPVDYQRLRRYVTPAQPLFQTEYETSILEGVRTLQSLGVNSESVFVADMVNPFPFILQLPPLQGDLSVYVRDRTYSPTEHVEAPALLSQADLVMVPKVAVTAGERDSLLALYGAFIRRHFGVVADTPWWTIWRARP